MQNGIWERGRMKNADGQVLPHRSPQRRDRGGGDRFSAGQRHPQCKVGTLAQSPGSEYPSEMAFDAISSRCALWGPEQGGQRFGNLKSVIQTSLWRE